MKEMSPTELATLSDSLPRNPDGSIRILFPWGFRIIQVNGENAVVPLSREELIASLPHDQRTVHPQDLCMVTLRPLGCVKNGCTATCHLIDYGGSYACACN